MKKNMKIETKQFRVREGEKVKLKKWPTKVKPFYKSKEHYQKILAEHIKELSARQSLLYADNRYALLLIFQAMDAAGKDGAIKHVMSGINPQGCEVFSFKHPSAEELEHDFLWRTTRCLPERGRIGIFNRSYYEEVLVVRVHPEIFARAEIAGRICSTGKTSGRSVIRSIMDLEKHLHRNGTRVVKFFLHLSKEEQRRRFLARIDDPDEKLEIQPGGHRGAEVLEGLHEGLRRLPGRDEHRPRAVVRRSRRRQGKRAAHHFANHPRHVAIVEDELSQNQQGAPQGIAVHPQNACKRMNQILVINGGSSSIKFALFENGESLRRILAGRIKGIGLPQRHFEVKGANAGDNFSKPIAAPDHAAAVNVLMDWIQERIQRGELAAVGHRVVHGGPKYWEPQRITPEMVEELHQLSPFDPEHLPEEILLTEAFHQRFPDLPQIACFDTAFHHDLPRVARLLPIPRRYEAKGVRRYGFHGLSCDYLMEELARVAGAEAAQGRVILAHLGNGASVTAVRGGKSMDTSMGFTPTAGLPMSTRSGDLDPGLGWYLSRAENVTAKQFHHMINHESGLLGVSETSSDMHELLSRENEDVRAAEAVALFCYQAKKWIGALRRGAGRTGHAGLCRRHRRKRARSPRPHLRTAWNSRHRTRRKAKCAPMRP